MSSCSECVELQEVLQVAHDAFQRERARAEALTFEVQRLERDLEILRVESVNRGVRAKCARVLGAVRGRVVFFVRRGR